MVAVAGCWGFCVPLDDIRERRMGKRLFCFQRRHEGAGGSQPWTIQHSFLRPGWAGELLGFLLRVHPRIERGLCVLWWLAIFWHESLVGKDSYDGK